MTYGWSSEQRKGLTYGSTVEVKGKRITLGRDVTPHDDWIGAVRAYEVDPGTLRPPSIHFIDVLLVKRFGESWGAADVPAGGYVHIHAPGIDLKVYDTATRDRYRAAVVYALAMMEA